jgi:putative glutamine transport system substrate-binding protein
MNGTGLRLKQQVLGSLFLWIAMAIPMLSTAQQLEGDSWNDVKEKGEGTIVWTYIQTPAFTYEQDGELTGICVDIMESFVNFVEKTHNVTLNVEYVEGDNFSSYYQSMTHAKGGVFGLANTTITEERKQEVDFSPPFITNIAILVTHNSVPDLTSMNAIGEQFTGMKAFAPSGSMHFQRIQDIKEQYYPGLEIEIVPSSKRGLDRINNGEKAFSYQDIALFWNYKEKGYPIKRHATGDKSSEKFGIMMPKGSDWTPIMEDFFAMGNGFKSTSIYRSSLVKHLGPEVLEMLQMSSGN